MSSEELNELLETLAATPVSIQRLLENIPDERLRWRHSEGEFSCVEAVCHLRDIEVEGYALRITRILSEDRPLLPDIDGARLAKDRDYNQQDVREALSAFARSRNENTTVLKALGGEQLNRQGTLAGVGAVQLKDLLLMMREHDADHIREIEQVRQRLADNVRL